MTFISGHLPDLRFGHVPLPDSAPGYDPAGDATALMAPGLASPAAEPIPGTQFYGSLGDGHRYVVRIPDAWNGNLAACGTPAVRSESANDLTLGDDLLARGYAFVCSNKGVPFNAVVESAAASPDRAAAYPIPFDALGLRAAGMTIRSGAVSPRTIPVSSWQEDLPATIRAAKDDVARLAGRSPARTYALGASIGGGQVRYLLERYPELVDGGVEWAAVYWSPAVNVLTVLPAFLQLMPQYVRSGYRDADAHAALVEAGFPPDRVQDDPEHPSLWDDHYANVPPFYADFTTFLFAKLLDPEARSWCGPAPAVRNPVATAGAAAAEEADASGLALPSARAAYTLSEAGANAIGRFRRTGALERPLIGVAGNADVFITPEHHALGYHRAVLDAGRGENYELYVVDGGTHVDAYVRFGYGLQAQAPFVWRAFERLVGIVEGSRPAPTGGVRVVRHPHEIAAPA